MSSVASLGSRVFAGRARVLGVLLGLALITGGLICPGPSYALGRASQMLAQLGCGSGETVVPQGGMGILNRTIIRKPSSPSSANCIYVPAAPLIKSPHAHIYVTSNVNPGGSFSVYNNHPAGAWYDAEAGLWAVANQDAKPIASYASFNVAFTDSDPQAGAHVTSAANTSGHISYLDHPLANGNPSALIQASPSWNSSTSGAIHAHVIGVWYDAKKGRWALFNQDFAPMPLNSTFQIYVAQEGAARFVQRATATNTYGSATWIENPATDGKPYAVLIVTPNWNPNGAGGTYNNHVTGVWYDPGKGKWAILNQDSAAMPTGASFNILVLE